MLINEEIIVLGKNVRLVTFYGYLGGTLALLGKKLYFFFPIHSFEVPKWYSDILSNNLVGHQKYLIKTLH